VALFLEQMFGELAHAVGTSLRWNGLALGLSGGAVRRLHDTDTLFHRLHVQPPLGGDSGRQRTIHAADHCHDLTAPTPVS
jgi:hypothetical protein